MTEQVRKKIKKMKELNRQQRKRKNLIWERYKEQKNKEIRKHEEKIVEEIKQDKGGKELWKNIRKISGKEVKIELIVYDEHGKELEELEAEKRIKRFWKQTLYQTHQNKINE